MRQYKIMKLCIKNTISILHDMMSYVQNMISILNDNVMCWKYDFIAKIMKSMYFEDTISTQIKKLFFRNCICINKKKTENSG